MQGFRVRRELNFAFAGVTDGSGILAALLAARSAKQERARQERSLPRVAGGIRLSFCQQRVNCGFRLRQSSSSTNEERVIACILLARRSFFAIVMLRSFPTSRFFTWLNEQRNYPESPCATKIEFGKDRRRRHHHYLSPSTTGWR